ncbi:pyrimidine 5'-nucleotidase [Phycomyces nitens]|nr:pyrimidine 5'-nucleotidase [Phycomyces nitens]
MRQTALTVTEKANRLVSRLLQNPTVRIQNQIVTKSKLTKILDDGHPNLHFICDFDMTMSRHWVRNHETDALERNASSHGIPGKYSKISPEFKVATKKIYNTYYPIEINRGMTHEEKVPFMIEWWETAHKLIIEQKITKNDITDMVQEARLELRPVLKQVLDRCMSNKIPFLVFSAGIGNIIEDVLVHAGLFHKNMHIVSNMMEFNSEDVCVGFREPLIHVFNKSEFQLETTDYYTQIENRQNVILVGDSLGDLQMSKGVRHEMCLNIGFLNHDIEALEPKYTEMFDIVIVGDANMLPIQSIIDSLVEQ